MREAIRDWGRVFIHFLAFIAVGLALYGLCFLLNGCHTVGGAGQDLKEAAKLLPEPYGTIADVAGTALVLFAGHKTYRHVRKRNEAKKALLKP